MYKLITAPFSEQAIVIFDDEHCCYIPFDLLNSEYQHFLNTVACASTLENIVDGEIPEIVKSHIFEKQTANYILAVKRLEQFKTIDGKPAELKEEILDSWFNLETEKIENKIDSYIVSPEILPEPEFITVKIPDDNQGLTEKTIRNPLIVKDEEERDAAQAVIDATPQEVIDYVNNK